MLNIFRLIVVLFLIYLLYRLFKGIFLTATPKINGATQSRSAAEGEDLVEDPNCHRYLPMSQTYRATIDGRDVFFCSKQCHEQYNSEKDLKKE